MTRYKAKTQSIKIQDTVPYFKIFSLAHFALLQCWRKRVSRWFSDVASTEKNDVSRRMAWLEVPGVTGPTTPLLHCARSKTNLACKLPLDSGIPPDSQPMEVWRTSSDVARQNLSTDVSPCSQPWDTSHRNLGRTEFVVALSLSLSEDSIFTDLQLTYITYKTYITCITCITYISYNLQHLLYNLYSFELI